MVPGQQNLFSLDGHVALVTGARGVIVHVGLQDNEPGLDTRRLTLQEIGFFGAYCYRHQDFATALDLLTGGKVTGEGWTEIRPLDDGTQAFIDIDQGRAPPKIILATG